MPARHSAVAFLFISIFSLFQAYRTICGSVRAKTGAVLSVMPQYLLLSKEQNIHLGAKLSTQTIQKL